MLEKLFVHDAFPSRPFWVAVLRDWLRLLGEYETAVPSDADLAYWHGERPLTGLLGVAAWQIGGWSLEEFRADRKRKDSDEIGKGRGDLWLGWGQGESAAKFTVEAKICWIDQQDREVAERDVLGKLDQARSQLRQLSEGDQCGDPVSVCYVVPCYSGSGSADRGKETLRRLEDRAQQPKMATAMYHGRRENITDTDDGPGETTYPGVLLVARHEDWSKT